MSKGAYLSVWFPDENLKRWLGALAALEGISRSEWVRQAIARELERRASMPSCSPELQPLLSDMEKRDAQRL